MGAAKIFATGRGAARQVAPTGPGARRSDRAGGAPDRGCRDGSDGGYGVDALIETPGPNAPVATMLDSFNALRRGGKAIKYWLDAIDKRTGGFTNVVIMH